MCRPCHRDAAAAATGTSATDLLERADAHASNGSGSDAELAEISGVVVSRAEGAIGEQEDVVAVYVQVERVDRRSLPLERVVGQLVQLSVLVGYVKYLQACLFANRGQRRQTIVVDEQDEQVRIGGKRGRIDARQSIVRQVEMVETRQLGEDGGAELGELVVGQVEYFEGVEGGKVGERLDAIAA